MTRTENSEAEKITTSVVMVDAEIAQRWLKRNTRNRPISGVSVERYFSDMIAGRWTFTGEPIQFSSDGSLLNGQHRLTAISKTGDLTLPFVVVRGLPNESQLVMDQGRKRTPGQQLALLGMKDSNLIAAAVKRYLVWDRGLLFRDNKNAGAISSAEITEWIECNESLIQQVSPITSEIRAVDLPPSVTYSAAFRFALVDFAATEQFFTALNSRVGLEEGSPLLAFDTRVRRMRREGIKIPDRDSLALILQTWNAWRSGHRISKFQRPRGGKWTAENFPEPR